MVKQNKTFRAIHVLKLGRINNNLVEEKKFEQEQLEIHRQELDSLIKEQERIKQLIVSKIDNIIKIEQTIERNQITIEQIKKKSQE